MTMTISTLVVNCFVLFGSETMFPHLLCVYKSPTLSATAFIPSSALAPSEDRFLAVHLPS